MRIRSMLFLASALAAATLAASPANAEPMNWPTHLVHIVVPQAAGGGTDFLGRFVAEGLHKSLGQPVIVDNRPGAGGNIGTEYVAKQPADGYTILLTTNTHVTNVSFFKNLPYDPVKDFEPVSLIATIPFVMAVNADFPAKNLKEFIAYARAHPGTITYGSGGIGTPHQLAAELLKSMTGIQMTHVPYKGSSPVVRALVAHEITTTISAVNSMLPFVRAGKLRPLGVAAATRTQLMPDVPTIAEAVPLPGYAIDIWYGVLVPAGTPRAIVDRLSTEINRIMRDPQTAKTRLNPIGLDPVGTTPEYFAKVIKSDLVKYEKIAKDANIQAQ